MKALLTFLALTCAILVVACSSIRYSNSDGKTNDKSLGDLIRWGLERKRPEIVRIDLSDDYRQQDLESPDPYLIWIGHATFLLNTGENRILFDPIFSDRASFSTLVGPQRIIPPAIAISELPRIDAVLISHNHYDHLDTRSLEQLHQINPDTIFMVPDGDKVHLRRAGIVNVHEFDWWESLRLHGMEFTFTPAQHWSSRTFFDRNKSLWGGWFVREDRYAFFHAGDTGYSEDFVDIRKKLGNVDYAMIPIGAYDPRWFMSYQHVNPEEAVAIARDINADVSFGMHWGTFVLTDEPIMEPKKRVEAAAALASIDFRVPTPGMVYFLD